jgi:hypothetical protein
MSLERPTLSSHAGGSSGSAASGSANEPQHRGTLVCVVLKAVRGPTLAGSASLGAPTC